MKIKTIFRNILKFNNDNVKMADQLYIIFTIVHFGIHILAKINFASSEFWQFLSQYYIFSIILSTFNVQ